MAVDPGTGQVNLRALFPNPEQILLPGLYVRVRLAQGVDQQALVVPEQAIQRTADGNSTVVLIKDGKATFTPIQVGPRTDTGYIVYQGIQAGDQLMVEGFQKVRPGAPVQPMPWKAQGGQAGQGAAQPPAAGGQPGAEKPAGDKPAGDQPADGQAH